MGKTKIKVEGVGLKGGERIKTVEAGPVIKEKTKTPGKKDATAEAKKVRGKKYQNVKAKVDKAKLYKLAEAIKLLKEISYTNFDGTVEIHLVVKKAGLTAEVLLPHFVGRKKKIEIADEATLVKLKTGKIDFDVLLAKPEFMPKLVPYAAILGPKGLMPNPKNKTIIKTEEDAKEFSKNKVQIKTEKTAPVIHIAVGKIKQKEQELVENINAVLDVIDRKKILKAYLCSTMSPSIKLEI